ncbi:MAG TPA: pyrroline-5-carboxylate reductase [Armatimonadota bacterium]|nr:pyrroline-5-carboxylate reductase [Armatimonadota bacterium]
MPERTRRLLVIGAGAMGQALVRGLIAADVYAPGDIGVADIAKERLSVFSEETGVMQVGNVEGASHSGIILIAVKPAAVNGVLDEISGYVGSDQTVISIAAGVTLQQIGSKLRSGVPIIRAMPNTPSMVGAGATAISRGKMATDIDVERAKNIFGAVGKVIEVPEKLMDAVTGLSGSGPAYVYTMIETLADAGVNAGLPRDQAALLAAQTVFGAAKMVIETGEHPAKLRDAVTSPGGTTIAGIAALERGAFRATVHEAVEAAVDRSRDMSRNAE